MQLLFFDFDDKDDASSRVKAAQGTARQLIRQRAVTAAPQFAKHGTDVKVEVQETGEETL